MPDDELLEILRGVGIFRGLEPEFLVELASRLRQHVFEAGQAICQQGNPGDSLFVVLEGRASIEVRSDDEPALVLGDLAPGDYAGELTLLNGKSYSCSVVALDRTHTLALHRDDFRDFLRDTPDAALRICATMGEELRKTFERLHELAIGRQIQRSLLPPPQLRLDCYEIVSRSDPAAEVGGDFYNIFELIGGGRDRAEPASASLARLGVVLGDVAGKGVPAALFMAVTTTLIEGQARLLPSPAETLTAANAALHPKMRPLREGQPLFATAVYGVLDAAHGEMRLANAGQTPPIYWPASQEPRYVRLTGLPLGAWPAATYTEEVIRLAPGDRLVFCSDGFIEERDVAGEPVGYTGFLRRLAALAERSGPELIEALFATEGATRHDPPDHDDRTLVLITVLAPSNTGVQTT